MKSFLTVLSFIPLLLVGGVMAIVTNLDEYSFVTMKIFACIGVFAVVYGMYKFTGYLHKKIDEHFDNIPVLTDCKKFVLVYDDSFENITFLSMKKCTKILMDNGIEIVDANRKELYFETSKVKVQYLTKKRKCIRFRCDEAFGFGKLTKLYLRMNLKDSGWPGGLVEYILACENN